MMLGTSQLTPPFVVRENVAGLLKPRPITFSGLMRVPTGLSTRSQTRYTKFEFPGSAVDAWDHNMGTFAPPVQPPPEIEPPATAIRPAFLLPAPDDVQGVSRVHVDPGFHLAVGEVPSGLGGNVVRGAMRERARPHPRARHERQRICRERSGVRRDEADGADGEDSGDDQKPSHDAPPS